MAQGFKIKPVMPAPLLAKASGILFGVYILSGRWGFGRLFGEDTLEQYFSGLYEIRLWIVLMIAILTILPRGTNMRPVHGSTVLKYTVALFLFFFYVAASALWSPDAGLAAGKAYEVFLAAVATLSLYRIFSTTEGAAARDYFWYTVVFITGILSLGGIYKVMTLELSRVAVLGGGPNVFGRLMGFLFIGALYFWRKGERTYYWTSVMVISGILTLLSGSRGSFIALIFAVFTFFIVERIRLSRLFVLAITAGVITFIILYYTSTGDFMMETYHSRIEKLLIERQYGAGREDLYLDAYNLGIKQPVFGAGLAAFPALGLGAYPHNFFLELFSETGMLGLASILSIFFLFAVKIWKKLKAFDGASVSAFVLILAASQFSGDFYDSRGIFFFLLMSLLPKSQAMHVTTEIKQARNGNNAAAGA